MSINNLNPYAYTYASNYNGVQNIATAQNTDSDVAAVGTVSTSGDSIQISNTAASITNQDKSNPFVSALDSLVSAGTITQDQETAIKNAMETARKSHHHHHGYSSNGNSKARNPLDSLVSNGTITSEQKDTITNAISAARQTSQQKIQDENNKLKSTLDDLVKSGTITQEQENSITSTFDSAAMSTSSDTNNS